MAGKFSGLYMGRRINLGFDSRDVAYASFLGAFIAIGLLFYFNDNPGKVLDTNLKLSGICFTVSALLLTFVSDSGLDDKIKREISVTTNSLLDAGIGFILYGLLRSHVQYFFVEYAFFRTEIYSFLLAGSYLIPCFLFGAGLIGLRKISKNLEGIGVKMK